MKRKILLFIISFCTILFILLLKNNNTRLELNSDKDFEKVEQFFREKFKEYDNKFTSVTFFITPNNPFLEKIVVNYDEEEINYKRIWDTTNGFIELAPTQALHSTFGMDKIQLTLFPKYIEQAKQIILEKDNNYQDFRIKNISYHSINNDISIQFRIFARYINTSSLGKDDLDYTEFNFFVDKKNKVKLMGD
ncbi:MAG: hypothetical protein Q3983_02640 [Capnocytophaga sp.]|nr:hypothetical protein [Capnocytophaga sp.]